MNQDTLPSDLYPKVKIAKQMAREEMGLPESEKRFGMHITAEGITLTHKKCTDIECHYTWHEIELEMMN